MTRECGDVRSSTLDRIGDNPFYVLGLRPTATRAEIEREGQKLLGMLELGLKSSARYATAVGVMERTPDKVRRAMAELRDPDRRLEHELWARLEPAAFVAAEPAEAPAKPRAEDAWADALVDLGWRAAP
jgi:hypothetical protein